MKKFLSLVMALVMVMSLTVIGAGAKDFTDSDTITYDEAIDVISALEVVGGYSDGSFQPNTELNRGQAAKIICNLILGVAAADNLTATSAPFPDVPASHHFAGYIAYCAQEGIIGGYSDGYFRPGNTLSGYAFMKMLLGALGYDSANEGLSGSNWTIQVAKLVQGVGLDADLEDDFVGSKAVTRQEACLYALNTLQARTVEYKTPGTTISVNGIEINQKASAASYRTYDTIFGGSTTDKNDGNIENDGYVQFAEEHFSRLVLNAGEADKFGRPEHTWTYKGEKVGSYTDTPDATYEGQVTQADLYDDLALTSTNKYFKVYINGASPTNFYTLGSDEYQDDGPAWVQNASKELDEAKIGSKTVRMILAIDDNSVADDEKIGTGAGSVIEVYKSGVAYNDKTADTAASTSGTIVVVDTYIGEVTSVNEAEGKHAANIEISPVGNYWEEATTINNDDGSASATFLTGDFDDTFDTDKFDVGDIVTFNYQYSLMGDKASVKKVAKAETVEGEVKDYTDQESFTLGGTEYKYSKMATEKVNSQDIGTNIIAYLDKQGNVLYFDEGKDNNKNYALVLDAGTRSAVGRNTFEAELLFADGTTKLVQTDKQYGLSSTDTTHGSTDTCWIGQWVTYRENANGRYVLTKPAVNKTNGATCENMMTGGHKAETDPATNGEGSFTIGDINSVGTNASRVVLGSNQVRINSNTVIIVKIKDDTFKVYNGLKNLPKIENGKILYSAMTRANQTYAKFLYVDATDPTTEVSNRTNTDLFLVGADVKHSSDGNNEYYAFKGVVDGVITNRIKLNWNDPDTQSVISDLLDGKGHEQLFCTFETDDGLYEVDPAYKSGSGKAAERGYVGTTRVEKVAALAIELDGGTYDIAEGCKFFRVDGSATNTRIVESTWKGISKGDIGTETSDRYAYVALSLNNDYEVTAIYWRMN